MKDRIYVDSNIWLYAFMKGNSEKTEKAKTIIREPGLILSTQVINELCTNLIKKANYSELEIQQAVKSLYSYYQVITIDKNIIIEASKIRLDYLLSYWDSLIVSSAILSECSVLYSEDMQHNQKIQNTKIINPFFVE
ncbi:MAG: PIN domain-containing protein [Leptospiraceae bacterium]|nr:PIN domain-containing protein [Leptospiraceae bacterium]